MNYWDASAIVEAIHDPEIRQRLRNEKAYTRPHALTETFSALTKNPETRIPASDAARILRILAESLSFVEISAQETLRALDGAEKRGVRGGRVHDYLHAIAAKKCGAKKIVTLDKNDFAGLTEITVEVI